MQGRVQVEGHDAGGGCAVTARTVITAAHVVRKARSPDDVTFVIAGGGAIPVKSIERDLTLDLAVLRLVLDVTPSFVAEAAKGDVWEVNVGPAANDPYLSGVVDFPLRDYQNDQGFMQHVVQLRVLQEIKEYEGFSGSAVTLPEAHGSIAAVLTEQQLERTRPRAGGPKPAGTNVLYAVPIAAALRRFGLTEAAGLRHRPANAGDLHGVPDLPVPFVFRSAAVVDIRDRILSRPASSGTGRVIVLHGMPGVGKSVLAAAVLREPEVRQAFPDGLIWIPVGKTEDLLAGLRLVGHCVGDTAQSAYAELPGATARLGSVLADRTCLIVLDDVLQVDDIVPFTTALGESSLIIATTRDRAVATALEADVAALDQFDDEEARTLLAAWARTPVDALPGTALAVARLCGNLPLALALCGAMVREGALWADLVEALEDVDLRYLSAQLPNYPHPDLFRAIQVSIDSIRARSPVDVQRFLELGVFERPEALPEAAIETLWCRHGDMPPRNARKLLSNLAARALLRVSGAAPYRQVRFHDLIWNYLTAVQHRQDGLDAELVDAYRAVCPSGWHNAPDDGYFFSYLPTHLKRAGKLDELRLLLLDPRWLGAQLRAAGVSAVITDFGLVDEPVHRRIGDALRLARVNLQQDPSQLAEQLMGRLLSSSGGEINAFLDRVAAVRMRPWLRSTAGTLRTPDGPLRSTVYAHAGGVRALDVTPDGTTAVTLGIDGLVKVWNLAADTELGRLSTPDCQVTALAVTRDGTSIVTGREDGDLDIWDLGSCRRRTTLRGGGAAVTVVAVGRNDDIVVGAQDGTLHLWSINRSKPRFLGHHDGPVHAVVASVSGLLVASAASDDTMAVWDIPSLAERFRFAGRSMSLRSNPVTDVALSPDEKKVIIALGSDDMPDGEISVRDIADGIETHHEELKGEIYYTLSDADGGCRCLETTDDGRWICGMGDSSVRILGPNGVAILTGHIKGVVKLRAVSDTQFVSASTDGTLRQWRADLGPNGPASTGHNGRVNDVAMTPDSSTALSASWDKTLRLWHPVTGTAVRELTGHTDMVMGVVIAPDASWAASVGYDGTFRYWDLANPDGSRVLSTSTRAFTAIAMSPDGGVVVAGGDLSTDVYQYHDKAIRVWDTRLPSPSRTLEGKYTGSLSALAITPDARLAAACASSGDRLLWNLTTGEQVAERRGPLVRALAILPDSATALSTWDDDSLRLWDLMTGDIVGELRGHTDRVNDVAVAKDGSLAVSCGSDQQAIVWDLLRGQVLARFYGDTRFISVDMSANGRAIVVGETTGAVHMLTLET